MNNKKKNGNDGKSYYYDTTDKCFQLIGVAKHELTSTLPSNAYKVKVQGMTGIITLHPTTLLSDDVYDIPLISYNSVIKRIESFLSDEKKVLMKDAGLLYKYAGLLYGEPGVGKSCLVSRFSKYVIEKKEGIVIYSNQGLDSLTSFLEEFREIEPTRLVMVILEEFDGILKDVREEMILNLLDGTGQIENVIYIATTNFIDTIPKRFLRPGRFTQVIEVTKPDLSARRYFFEKKLGKTHNLIDQLSKKTQGLTLDQLKDVFISVCIFDENIEEVITRINNTTLQGTEDRIEICNTESEGDEEFLW